MKKVNIKKVTICGYGLIGGCIALDLLASKKKIEIVAYDRKSVLEKIKKDSNHNVSTEKSFKKAVQDSDMIILSAPHNANEEMLYKLHNNKNIQNCLILDTGAVKSPITQIAKALDFSNGVQFLPTHPMAGREKAGFKNASTKLFQEHAWYISDDIILSYENQQKIAWLIQTVKALRVHISSSAHDELVSQISHLPQLISTLLGSQTKPELIPLAGPGLRSMLRLSGSPYSVWQEIITENKTEIIEALKIYKNNLDDVIKKIKNDESLEKIFKDSSRSYTCL